VRLLSKSVFADKYVTARLEFGPYNDILVTFLENCSLAERFRQIQAFGKAAGCGLWLIKRICKHTAGAMQETGKEGEGCCRNYING
jgi:hypothetical protein